MRKVLIPENRFGRYFFYALGEIVLVVIGILIALQVNNWNQDRKDRNLEVNIITEIKDNLNNDLSEIQSDISVMDSVTIACNAIIQSLKSNDTISESFTYEVAKLTVNPHFDPNKSGYSLLVSKGVEIIQNDSLRKSISRLYESGYSYYYRYEEERTQFKINQINPKLAELFSWIVKPELFFFAHFEITENEFIKIKSDESFFKLVYATKFYNETVKNRAQRIESNIEALINQLETELETKKI